MPHPIPAPDLTPFKKGDRVQNLESGNFGTVYQDQTDPLLVHLVWDAAPNEVVCHKADSVRVAPWHEVNAVKIVQIDVAHLRNFREAGLLDPEKLPKPDAVPPMSGLAKELGRLAEDLEAAIMYGPDVLRNDAAAVASKLRALSKNL